MLTCIIINYDDNNNNNNNSNFFFLMLKDIYIYIYMNPSQFRNVT